MLTRANYVSRFQFEAADGAALLILLEALLKNAPVAPRHTKELFRPVVKELCVREVFDGWPRVDAAKRLRHRDVLVASGVIHKYRYK